jgi:hypothetical protein
MHDTAASTGLAALVLPPFPTVATGFLTIAHVRAVVPLID